MRSTLVLLALVAAVSSTALLRHPKDLKDQKTALVNGIAKSLTNDIAVPKDMTNHIPKTLTKEVKQHKKPRGWYVKFYFDTFAATGNFNVLDGLFCPLCEDIVDDLEKFGEETAMDYLSDALTDMCSGLKYPNLQKDCYDYFMEVAQDLIDLLNNNMGGEEACTYMTLC